VTTTKGFVTKSPVQQTSFGTCRSDRCAQISEPLFSNRSSLVRSVGKGAPLWMLAFADLVVAGFEVRSYTEAYFWMMVSPLVVFWQICVPHFGVWGNGLVTEQS